MIPILSAYAALYLYSSTIFIDYIRAFAWIYECTMTADPTLRYKGIGSTCIMTNPGVDLCLLASLTCGSRILEISDMDQ